MYPIQAFKRAVSDTTTYWSVHRNWTFAAGPVGVLAYLVLHEGWRRSMLDWQHTGLAALGGFAFAWIGSLAINMLRSPALLHRDLKRELSIAKQAVIRLTSELETERESLINCPQLVFWIRSDDAYQPVSSWTESDFLVRNSSEYDALV